MEWKVRRALFCALFACVSLLLPSFAFAQVPKLTVEQVLPDTNSVKVDIQPYPGAQDYVAWPVDNPNNVEKFAGLWHLDTDTLGYYSSAGFEVDASGNPIYNLSAPWPHLIVVPAPHGASNHHIDIPALELEVNNLVPGQPTAFNIAAVSALGPSPFQSLYGTDASGYATRLFPLDLDCNPLAGDCFLGSNMGCNWLATQSGILKMDINGQGDYHNNPTILAQTTIILTATGKPALPSMPSATQVCYSNMDNGSVAYTGNANGRAGTMDWTFASGRMTGLIHFDQADVQGAGTALADSEPFFGDRHFMDVLHNGGTPGSGIPANNNYTTDAIEPSDSADVSSGQWLHVTMEVDAHLDPFIRRWVGVFVYPASDQLSSFREGTPIDASGNAVFFQPEGGIILSEQFTGHDANGNALCTAVAGAVPLRNGYRQQENYQLGRGLDNRSRFDFFVSATAYQVYEDGHQIESYPWPIPLAWAQNGPVKVAFTHYDYHLDLAKQLLQKYAPYESYWIDTFPYSDERHWANMGFEVLPAKTTNLGGLIQIPQAVAPTFPPPNLTGKFTFVSAGFFTAPRLVFAPAGGGIVSLTDNSAQITGLAATDCQSGSTVTVTLNGDQVTAIH